MARVKKSPGGPPSHIFREGKGEGGMWNLLTRSIFMNVALNYSSGPFGNIKNENNRLLR